MEYLGVYSRIVHLRYHSRLVNTQLYYAKSQTGISFLTLCSEYSTTYLMFNLMHEIHELNKHVIYRHFCHRTLSQLNISSSFLKITLGIFITLDVHMCACVFEGQG